LATTGLDDNLILNTFPAAVCSKIARF